MRRISAQSGFTLLESAISVAVFAVLVASLLAISIETSHFVNLNDTDALVQLEADRAFTRMAEILRKSGRVDLDGTIYPRVAGGGGVLQFRVPLDADGNGYPLTENGDLEWNADTLEIRTDEYGNLRVYSGTEPIYHLGRYVSKLSFETIDENSDLNMREIRVTFETRKATGQGHEMVRSFAGSIHMRN